MTRNARALLLSLLATAAPLAEAAGTAELPGDLARELHRHGIAPEDLSVYVHEIGAARPRLAFNASMPRNPASTIKLLTTQAALDLLGPQYVWSTEIYATGDIEAGRLEGDLIIKGYGDPVLGTEAAWRLLWGARERGIATIGRDMVLDAEHFEPPQGGRGDFDGNARSAYNALPSALSVSAQTTLVHLLRDSAGGGVRVFTDPPLANLAVDNGLRLIEAPCQRKFHRPVMAIDEKDPHQAVVRLTGTFASRCGEAQYPRLLLNPIDHAAGAFAALWTGMGGTIQGGVRAGRLPEGARLLHRHHSPPLEEVIRHINKRSDNLMSRTLFLTLGAERRGAPGSLSKSREVVGEWLLGVGLDFPELVIDNGSGLSRDARISAESLGRLLGYAYASPTMPQLVASLAIAGVDGTMRKRFRKGRLTGQAHLKTGTLRGVSALAGFVQDEQGRRWILVSLINGNRLQVWRAKGVENALLEWVYANAGEEPAPLTRAADGTRQAWFLKTAAANSPAAPESGSARP